MNDQQISECMDVTKQKRVSIDQTLFDDESVREKLTVMTKMEALFDDARNDDEEFWKRIEDNFFVLGKTYRITITELP